LVEDGKTDERRMGDSWEKESEKIQEKIMMFPVEFDTSIPSPSRHCNLQLESQTTSWPIATL
jgi:hypothetical protein